MKILLIRHGEVAMTWKQRCTPEEYNKAVKAYEEADIVPIDRPQDTGDYERIYVSTEKRAIQTQKQLFPTAGDDMVTQTPLLDEVPLSAYTDSPKSRPRWVYDLGGRMQWRWGSGQGESYADTRERADALIDLIEKKNENVILITHGFFMNVLIRQLKRRKRYEIFRGSTFVIQPLEKIRVMDREPHCGGCHHNCLLKNAGCMIGQDKARKAGLM